MLNKKNVYWNAIFSSKKYFLHHYVVYSVRWWPWACEGGAFVMHAATLQSAAAKWVSGDLYGFHQYDNWAIFFLWQEYGTLSGKTSASGSCR